MGMICLGHNYTYFTAVEALLKEHGIAVLVQDVPGYWSAATRILTVPNADHDRALQLLKDAGLDPATANLATNE